MSHLFRYIFFQVTRSTFMVALVLLCVVWLSQSLSFVDMIVNHGLSISGFMMMSAYVMPNFISLILPISVFVGVLLVYIRLLNERELVVMRTSGVSPIALLAPALSLSVILTLILYAINLYFLPAGYRAFKEMQHELRNTLTTSALRKGTFNTFGDKLTVYIRDRDESGALLGILMHSMSDASKAQTFMAEKATLVRTEQGPRIILVNGNRQEMDRKTDTLTSLYFDTYVFDMTKYLDPETPDIRWRKPTERFMSELFNPDLSDLNNRENIHKFLAEAHHRLAWPLYCIALVFLAGVSVLSGSFNRRGQWMRLLPVIGIFLLTVVVGVSLKSVVASTLHLWPLLYGVPIAISGIIMWILVYPNMANVPKRSLRPS